MIAPTIYIPYCWLRDTEKPCLWFYAGAYRQKVAIVDGMSLVKAEVQASYVYSLEKLGITAMLVETVVDTL